MQALGRDDSVTRQKLPTGAGLSVAGAALSEGLQDGSRAGTHTELLGGGGLDAEQYHAPFAHPDTPRSVDVNTL